MADRASQFFHSVAYFFHRLAYAQAWRAHTLDKLSYEYTGTYRIAVAQTIKRSLTRTR